MKNIGIYVHIPFCAKKCEYCDFISFAGQENQVENYVTALCADIRASRDKAKECEVDTIYFGGGTPSFIESEYIEEILTEIRTNYNVREDAEITIEINPGTVNAEKLELYKEIGINRLSMGLQSTNDRLLKLIGRVHNFSEFLQNYKLARQLGFENINVDLMLALPTQSLDEMIGSARDVVALNPEHVSVYSLIVEDETPLQKKIEAGVLELVDERLERQMYWRVKEILGRAGYEHYEISNFAKEGFRSKHNENCWNQHEYLGFGLAAHSYFNNTRYANLEDLNKYIANIKAQKQDKNIVIEEKQDREAKAKEYMMLGFRKLEGITISEFERKFEINPLFYFRFEISELEEKDLIEVDLDNIRLTKKGLDFANLVFEKFV